MDKEKQKTSEEPIFNTITGSFRLENTNPFDATWSSITASLSSNGIYCHQVSHC